MNHADVFILFQGFIGGAIGFWNVTFGEPTCEPGWGVFFDKVRLGCSSPNTTPHSRIYRDALEGGLATGYVHHRSLWDTVRRLPSPA